MGLRLWTPGSRLEFQDHRTGAFGLEGAMATIFPVPCRGEHPCYFICDRRWPRVCWDLAASRGCSAVGQLL